MLPLSQRVRGAWGFGCRGEVPAELPLALYPSGSGKVSRRGKGSGARLSSRAWLPPASCRPRAHPSEVDQRVVLVRNRRAAIADCRHSLLAS